MRDQRTIRATYYLESEIEPERAAAAMAGEQSSGTFVAVPGESPELHERHAGRPCRRGRPRRRSRPHS
jgi:ribulose-bisphosphate carboxylase large chain